MPSGKQYAFLGAELLASQAGEGAIRAYLSELRPGTTWREAFQKTFGMSVEEFYRLFEEQRAAGFPNPFAPEASATLPGAPDFVKWLVGPNVPPDHLVPFVTGTRLMNEYAASLGLPAFPGDVKFHVFYDVESLAPVYYAVRGFKPRCSREWWFSQGRATSVGPSGIFMTTRDREPHSLVKIVAHEMFNAYQFRLSGLPVSGGSSDAVPQAGPRWLAEGVAEYLANRAAGEGGDWDFTSHRSRSVEKGRSIDEPLSAMETQTGFSAVGGLKYRYALLAAELLASHTGEDSLIRYYNVDPARDHLAGGIRGCLRHDR